MRRALRVIVALAAVMAASAAAAGAASADTLTAVCTSAGQSAPCSSSTWYPSTVTVVWTTDTPPDANPPPSCVLDATYLYDADTTGNPPISCSASWSDGTTVSKKYQLHVETSPLAVSSSLSRPPDSNGWYTRPVTVSFSGSSFSGIASCTGPTTYSGGTLTGSCTDNAGKVATTTVSLANYDATPPTITGATASRRPDYKGWYTKPVSFTFTGTDVGSGIAGCQVVRYTGSAGGSVTGGCWDRAGNYAAIRLRVPFLRVIARRSVAGVASAPVLLRWRSVRHATYYNVQLFRGNRKLLSTWPSSSNLFLSRTWRFNGRGFRLKPGRYRWYVWPGYGSRKADRYGPSLISATFTVA